MNKLSIKFDLLSVHGEFQSMMHVSRLIRHRDTVTPLVVSHLWSSDCFRLIFADSADMFKQAVELDQIVKIALYVQ